MKAAAEHITEVLELPGITAKVSQVFWEIAEAGTEHPFVNFSVIDEGPASRDGIRQYNAQLRIYADRLTEGSDIATTIQNEIKNSTYSWKDRGGRSSYVDAEAKEAYIEVNFEFKL